MMLFIVNSLIFSQVLVPPHNTRFIAWGFGDLSMRTGYYETERVNIIPQFHPKYLLERRLYDICQLSSLSDLGRL